jgi:2-dehydropantoate 2-reductase
MRFIVYGAGAIGNLLGGYLAQTGHEVVLIGRLGHVARVRSQGLLLKNKFGLHTIRMGAVERVNEVSFGNGDVVLLTVKSQTTDSAVAELEAQASSALPVFCFQNGVRNEEIAARFFQNVYGGVVTLGARYTVPGQIVHLSGNLLTIGRYPEGLDHLAEAVGDALRTAGFKVYLHPKIMAVKWSKLLVNLANPVYGLTGLSVAEVHNSPEGRACLADLYDEGIAVLEAAGIEFAPIPGRQDVREEAESLRQPADPQPLPADPDFNYYPSTWQDLYLHRGATEIAHLNGEVVSLGERFGVPTPLNTLLTHLIEDMTAKGEPPGKYTLTELRAMSGRE